MITFVLSGEHQYTIRDTLETRATPYRGRINILSYEDFLGFRRLPISDYVFTDLERLSEQHIHAAAGRLRNLCAAHPDIAVLNPPQTRFRRYPLMQRLHGAGLNAFRVAKAGELLEDLRFPVFVRRMDDHRGPLSPLIHSLDELRAFLDRFADVQDLAVTEYVDTRNSEGLHQKRSYFRIGERYFPAALNLGTHWVCKGVVDRPEGDAQSGARLRFLKGNPDEDIIRPYFEAAGVTYGRADYAIVHGRPQVFEINTNPMIVPPERLPKNDRTFARIILANWLDALAAFSPPERPVISRWVDAGEVPEVALPREHGRLPRRLTHRALAATGNLHRETAVVRPFRYLRVARHLKKAGTAPQVRGNVDWRAAGIHVVHATEVQLGGVITYLDELIGTQAAPDFRAVDVIAPAVNLPALAGVLDRCATVVGYNQDRRSARGLARLVRHTLRHVRRTRPDILHLHSSLAGAALRLCAPLLPRETRIVYCPHGWAFSRFSSDAARRQAVLIERGLARVADRIVCVSNSERREALRAGIPEARLAVVENGIGGRPYGRPAARPAEGEPLLIGFAGRLDRQKGFDTFAAVMRALGPRARGRVIGSAIADRGGRIEMPDNVEHLGWQPRDRVFQLCSEVDLMLIPSRWEGMPLIVIEAMQARTPVFGSRIGGIEDLIADGETGRLFAPEDVDGIVAMILSTSRADLRRYGERAHQRYVARHTTERMAREIRNLYREVLDTPSVRRGTVVRG